MSDDGSTRGGRHPSKLWYVLLLSSFIATMWVSSYNSIEPSWQGIPFFVWYQFLWIVISAAVTMLVYLATDR